MMRYNSSFLFIRRLNRFKIYCTLEQNEIFVSKFDRFFIETQAKIVLVDVNQLKLLELSGQKLTKLVVENFNLRSLSTVSSPEFCF